jgi:hypothetical protein
LSGEGERDEGQRRIKAPKGKAKQKEKKGKQDHRDLDTNRRAMEEKARSEMRWKQGKKKKRCDVMIFW